MYFLKQYIQYFGCGSYVMDVSAKKQLFSYFAHAYIYQCGFWCNCCKAHTVCQVSPWNEYSLRPMPGGAPSYSIGACWPLWQVSKLTVAARPRTAHYMNYVLIGDQEAESWHCEIVPRASDESSSYGFGSGQVYTYQNETMWNRTFKKMWCLFTNASHEQELPTPSQV